MFWSTPDPLSVFFWVVWGGGGPIGSAVGHIPLPLPKTLNKIWGKGIHYGVSRPLAKKAARTILRLCASQFGIMAEYWIPNSFILTLGQNDDQ